MTEIVLDPHAPEFAANPYAVYARMRAQGPWFHAETDTWMLTRIADVERVVLDRSMVRALEDGASPEEAEARRRRMNWHDMPYHQRFVQTNLLESDGADHDRLRAVVARAFTPKAVDRLRPAIAAHVEGLLDTVAGQSRIDFIEDVAAHVPGVVIGRLLGVPDADSPRLRFWSEEVVRFFDPGRDDADKARAEHATRAFHDYLVDLLDRRASVPEDDLLTGLLARHGAGDLSRDELIATVMLILMAGHGSTIDVLGTGLLALLRFPQADADLRADPGLLRPAIDEMFRFDPPLPYFHRSAPADCTVGGRDFPAGTRFGLLYGAANRDPDRFDRPDMFDIHRPRARHVAFGGGAHFCLGNHLARMSMELVFTALHRRYRQIALAGDNLRFKPGLSVRGLESLPLVLEPA